APALDRQPAAGTEGAWPRQHQDDDQIRACARSRGRRSDREHESKPQTAESAVAEAQSRVIPMPANSTNSRRSTKVVLRSAQPCAAAASAASPSADFAVIKTISIQEPSFGSLSSKPMPCGSSTNTNGTRKAGSVYFQACSVVL